MTNTFKIAQWYDMGANTRDSLPEEVLRSFVEQGAADEVLGFDWQNTTQGHDFLHGLQDLAVDKMQSSNHAVVIVHPRAFQQAVEKKQEEFRHLMDAMKEALDVISLQDKERAARLAAKVYVHLKSSPIRYQRLFDGLLHKYTGVYHSNSHRSHDPSSD